MDKRLRLGLVLMLCLAVTGNRVVEAGDHACNGSNTPGGHCTGSAQCSGAYFQWTGDCKI